MNNKGFTLIELLAILIIMAVISLIAYPVLTSTQKKDQEKLDATLKKNTLLAVKTYLSDNNLDNKDITEISLNNLLSEGYITKSDYDFAPSDTVVCTKDDNQNLKCEYVIPTSEECFEFFSGEITDYYCYEGNAYDFETITDVIIPSKINGENVISIGYRAFYNKNLTSVVILESVTTIKEEAFLSNPLTSVKIYGKSSISDFTYPLSSPFGWEVGYSDSNIIWSINEEESNY